MDHAKPIFAFANSPLNRRAEWRSKGLGAIAATAKNCVWIRGDHVRMTGDKLFLDMPTNGDPEMIFLGEYPQHQLWFATQAPESEDLQPLRGLMQQQLLPPKPRPMHQGKRHAVFDQQISDIVILQRCGKTAHLQRVFPCVNRTGDIDGQQKGCLAGL